MFGSIRVCVPVIIFFFFLCSSNFFFFFFCPFISVCYVFDYVYFYILYVCLHVCACSYATCVWPEFYMQ